MSLTLYIPLIPPQGGRVKAYMRRHRGGPPRPGFRMYASDPLGPKDLLEAWEASCEVADRLSQTGTEIDLWIEPLQRSKP